MSIPSLTDVCMIQLLARAYVVGNAGKNPYSNVITGSFLRNNRYASILFDTGVDRSFVSTAFSSPIDIVPTILDNDYDVKLADGKIIRVNTIIRGCTLNFLNHPFNINLMDDIIIENSEEEVAETMAETVEQYMSKTRADFGSRIAKPKIDDKDHFELKGQFLKELRDNTFSDSDHEDANEHIEKVLEIVDLFHIPNITQDQVMLRAFPMSQLEPRVVG
ncbi:hypothetical protein Tco_1560938 [Tanacetum coccineum]